MEGKGLRKNVTWKFWKNMFGKNQFYLGKKRILFDLGYALNK